MFSSSHPRHRVSRALSRTSLVLLAGWLGACADDDTGPAEDDVGSGEDTWVPIDPDTSLVEDAADAGDGDAGDAGDASDDVGGDAIDDVAGDAIDDVADVIVTPDDTLDPHDTDVTDPGGVVRWSLSDRFAGSDARLRAAECVYASPLAWENAEGVTEILVTVGDVVTGVDADDGSVLWHVDLPEPFPDERAFAIATPLLLDDLLVVVYQTRPSDRTNNVLDDPELGQGAAFERLSHFVTVIDVAERRIADDFPLVRISAEVPGNGGNILFDSRHALSRSQVAHVPPSSGDGLGTAYLSYGNARDIQPWHGWLFEIDLDAWRADGAEAANSATFVTTASTDCGPRGSSGSFERRCGGGLWSPTGMLATSQGEIVAPAGNGQLHPLEGNFANTLMRFEPGLDFEHGCDPELCADFDVNEPSVACVESCTHLFVPRTDPAVGPPRPANGVCDGLSLFECWANLDYIGGSTPTELTLGDFRLLAYPTKDGHVYLVDADHLGTLHDRLQLVDYCGTLDDRCRWGWAGMIVNKPTLTTVGGTPRLLIATFMPDNTHPAGVVAVDVVLDDGVPTLRHAWNFPDFDTPEAVQRFRAHPTQISVIQGWGIQIAVVVETIVGRNARLLALNVATGEKLAEVELDGPGYRFITPLILGRDLYVPSCGGDAGPGTLLSYRLNAWRQDDSAVGRDEQAGR